VKDFDETPPTC